MNADDDKLLEEYLAGDSALSRRYRAAAGSELPSGDIDRRLRAAVRREVGSRPRRFAVRRSAWTRPLAAAAVVVVAVGVVLEISRHGTPTALEELAPPVDRAAPGRTEAPGPAPQSTSEAPAAKAHELRQAQPEEASRAPARAPAGTAAQSAARARSSPAAADADGGAQGGVTARDRDPRAWLDDVRRMLARGEVDAARDSLARFSERHPELPLPPDLRALLDPAGGGPGGEVPRD